MGWKNYKKTSGRQCRRRDTKTPRFRYHTARLDKNTAVAAGRFSNDTDSNGSGETTGRHRSPQTTRLHGRGKQTEARDSRESRTLRLSSTGRRPPQSRWRRARTTQPSTARGRRRRRGSRSRQSAPAAASAAAASYGGGGDPRAAYTRQRASWRRKIISDPPCAHARSSVYRRHDPRRTHFKRPPPQRYLPFYPRVSLPHRRRGQPLRLFRRRVFLPLRPPLPGLPLNPLCVRFFSRIISFCRRATATAAAAEFFRGPSFEIIIHLYNVQ